MFVSNTNSLAAFSVSNKAPQRDRSFVSQLSNEVEKTKQGNAQLQQGVYAKTKDTEGTAQPTSSLSETQARTKNSNTYKQTLSYINAFAINQYETFHNLESQKVKNELLGFSAYA